MEAQMTGIGLLDSSTAYDDDDDDKYSDVNSEEDVPRHAVCGALNQGRRVDYILDREGIHRTSVLAMSVERMKS